LDLHPHQQREASKRFRLAFNFGLGSHVGSAGVVTVTLAGSPLMAGSFSFLLKYFPHMDEIRRYEIAAGKIKRTNGACLGLAERGAI